MINEYFKVIEIRIFIIYHYHFKIFFFFDYLVQFKENSFSKDVILKFRKRELEADRKSMKIFFFYKKFSFQIEPTIFIPNIFGVVIKIKIKRVT